MSCKVAFIGLGVMGYPMAGYISAGHNVTVYNRTKSKAEKWIKDYKGNLAQKMLQKIVILFLLASEMIMI